MNPFDLRSEFIHQLEMEYPDVRPFLGPKLEELISPHLLSPFVIELPLEVLRQAQEFVEALFEERKKPEYFSPLVPLFAREGLTPPGNHSILMSYDFHLDSHGQLQLIEVNTNASFMALGSLMYKAHEISQPVDGFCLDDLRKDILNEIQLNGHSPQEPLRVAIVDEKPETQRLYIEFLVFAELFRKWGWRVDICDYRQMPKDIQFIYNRHTDFLFSEPSSGELREILNSRLATISPQPWEYFLLADKGRLIEWGNQVKNPRILKHLPQTQLLTQETAGDLWTARKELFFKPRQSFGSKQAYRGAKISRRLFDDIITQDFVAQTLVPPAKKVFQTSQGEALFKFDLRFFAYEGTIQSVVGRLYQGQVTNLQTPWGGFACVKFKLP